MWTYSCKRPFTGMNTRSLRGLAAAWLLLICGAPDMAHAYRFSKAPLMVGLGDSISAGAFADTSTQKLFPLPIALPIPNVDSLLDQFGFRSDFESKRAFSWVSGVMINSHYRHMNDYYLKTYGKKIVSLNFAESSAQSHRVLDQVDEINTAMKLGLFNSLPYITLLIGPNDLCASVPMETFRRNIHLIFEKIASIRPPDGQSIHILVSSIPRIPTLGEARILDYRTAAGYRCRAIRTNPLSRCRKMTEWKTEEERRHLDDLVNQANEILRSETLEAAQLFPSLKPHFSSILSEQKLEPADLAMDCFHPSQSGQEKIAESLWNEQPWFH